jgi:hypothetical protein
MQSLDGGNNPKISCGKKGCYHRLIRVVDINKLILLTMADTFAVSNKPSNAKTFSLSRSDAS